MTTESYIRDARFEAHGAAIKWSPSVPARWYPLKELRYVLAEHDWSDTFLISHHFQFDGLILSRHFKVHPRLRGCTLSMARLMLGNHISVSLDSVRKHFGLAPKVTPYNLFKGRHWDEITSDTQELIGEGACDEVESIWNIFQILLKQGFPLEEIEVIDTTMRMFTEPVLRADTNLLAQIWEREAAQKEARLAALDVDTSELQSADKFTALLQAEGVEIEFKDGKNGPIPAFAKTDDFMRGLLEDDNKRVRALAEARLGAKSTLMQTRAETLGWMASRGPLCVYLKFCGAHTTRWAGGDSTNMQNLKRGSDLRRAILPPEGFELATIDMSQIECRVCNFLAGQDDVIERFRSGGDPYAGTAIAFYGRTITKADAAERGTGKQAELSCMFGCGAPKFQATAKLGIYGPPVILSLETAKRFVDLYRSTHGAVTRYWKAAESVLKHLANGSEMEWGPMCVVGRKIKLPNGAFLNYETLEWHIAEGEGDETGWRMRTRHGWTRMYGAKLVEQTTQALARVIVSQAMIRIARLGYRIVNSEHDSLWILIPKDDNEAQHLQRCKDEMIRPLPWLPGLPLECEGELK